MGSIRLFLFLVLSSLIGGCANNFDSASTESETKEIATNVSIETLHSLLGSNESTEIREDMVARGSVTANDKENNFYKSFVIEWEGYGLEVLDGLTNSYVRFQEGYVVAVYLKGLHIARNRGVLQVGSEASAGSYYPIDYLGHELLVNEHLVNTGVWSEVTPREVSLSDFEGDDGALLVETLCGSLVTISGLSFAPDDDEDGYWGGTHNFTDEQGLVVQSYTSDYASFSMCEIPSERCRLTGILMSDYDGGDGLPIIKMRSQADCCIE